MAFSTSPMDGIKTRIMS